MWKRELFASSCLLLLVACAWTAPVKEQGERKISGTEYAQVQGEDQDLQELLSLVDKQTHRDDVMVHQEHMTHIENNNGQSVKVEQKEEKVIDTDTGKVLADVKQEKQTDFTPGEQTAPQTIVQTEVDIPQAGVHQSYVQGHDQASQETDDTADVVDESDNDDDDEPDLTPADMAAYLYETQQFSAFYAAMDRLVNESKMAPADAEAYARAVAVEYERLQLQDLQERYLLERRAFSQPMLDNQMYGQPLTGYDLYPQPVGVAGQPDSSFDMLNYINTMISPEEQYLTPRQAQNDDLMTSDPVDPYQFVAALWNEAYERGNEQAQEIVRLLYDRVSHDSNPDDMGEIKDILLDTVAQSLSEDTPYAFDTPIDTPLAMPQMPVRQQEAEPTSPMGVASKVEETKSGLKEIATEMGGEEGAEKKEEKKKANESDERKGITSDKEKDKSDEEEKKTEKEANEKH